MGGGRNIAVAGTSIGYLPGRVLYLYGDVRAMGSCCSLAMTTARLPTLSAEIISDHQASFISGWTYWLSWVVTCIADVVVCGSYMRYWFPELSAWMPALSMLAILFLLNLLSVKMFGEAEFWFALIR